MAFFMWDVLDYLRTISTVEIEDYQIPVIRSWKALRQTIQQMKHVKAKDFALVHAQFGSFVGLYAALLGLPLMLSLRGSDTYAIGRVYTRQGLSSRVRVFMSWMASVKARKILVMSEAMRSKVEKWAFVNKQKIYIVCDPVGDSFWEVERFTELSTHNPLKIMTGSLQADNPVKRLSIISDAIKICNASSMAIDHLQVSGIPREEMRFAIEKCDYLALPSMHEGWPNVVKETLLTGKNFIATNVSDLERYAPVGSGNMISRGTPIDFALSFTDAFVNKKIGRLPSSIDITVFHPLSCAYKHLVIYKSAATNTI